jgi:uncharacterized membrane protein
VEKIWELLRDPAFWIGTVIVGILINVGTSYGTRWLDKTVPSWRERRRKKVALQKEIYRRQVEDLSGDDRFFHLMLHYIRATNTKVIATFFGVVATFALVFATTITSRNYVHFSIWAVLFVLAFIVLFLSAFLFFAGAKMSDVAEEAARKLDRKPKGEEKE